VQIQDGNGNNNLIEAKAASDTGFGPTIYGDFKQENRSKSSYVLDFFQD
jgi:hypothetical protein